MCMLLLLVLVVQPLLPAAHTDFYEQVAASESSADFSLLVSQQMRAPSNDAPGTKPIAVEVPSRSQLNALALESPSILLAHTRRMHSLFALDSLRAQVDGRGRANRPSGISITRGLPLTTHKVDPAFHYGYLAMDDRALKFSPEQLHMGVRPTCTPILWHVEIVNSARVGLRLDDVEFTRGGFEVLTNVQGIVLEPSGRLTVQFLFTPSFPDETYEAFMRVFTSSGQFALRITAKIELHEFGVTGIRAIVPVATDFDTTLVMRNPYHNDVLRVLDVFSRDPIGTFSMPEGETAISPPSRAQPGGPRTGAWTIPPGERRRIVDYKFYSKHTGVFFTYIRIVVTASDHHQQQQVAIPVVIEVVPEGLHFEPSKVDLGVLTAYDPLRQVDVHLFNAASVPIKIYSVHVDETTTNMDIIVKMNGPIVIPPRTRIRHAINVRAAALSKRESDGQESDNVTECFATLFMKTNHSDVLNATMDIRGVWLKGTLAYDFNETLVGVVGSLLEAFGGENNTNEEEDEQEPSVGTRLQTMSAFMNGSIAGVHAGATVVRSLRLQNLYNVHLDLERVWVSPYRTSQGDNPLDIVHVDHFERGLAKSGEFWPGEVRLRVTPPRLDDLFAPRMVPVSIETNLMTHHVPVHVFYGFLQVKTRFRWLNHSQIGYQPASKPKGQKPLKKCLLVTDFDLNTQPKDGANNNVKLCRSFVLEMGKVSAHGAHTEVLNLTNVNPIPVDIKVASMIKSELFDLSILSTLSKARQASPEVAAVGRKYADQVAKSLQMNIMASLLAYTNPKAQQQNFKLHEDIVIPPGYDFTLQLGLKVGQELGAFTQYLLTLETPFEFLHVYARFESVTGVVRPVVTDVQLPPMFPGSTAFVDLHYQSTFAHNVPTHSVHVPRSLIQVVTTNTYIEAGRTHSGFSFLFSPSYSNVCVQSKYLADCLLPDIAEPTLGITLSDFGDDVSDEDMAQLGRRQSAWEKVAATNYTATAVMQLRTAIMDTDAVRVTAPLMRPSVAMVNASSGNGYAVIDFNLTKVLQRQARTVKVRNPSSISIDMELAVSVRDRALFYKCSNTDEDNEAACLKEWEALVLQGAGDATQSVAPFFVSRRVVRVLYGQEAELGPVYFFPSHAFEVDKAIFVRSELTHLESVRLLARSGKGALDLRMLIDHDEGDTTATASQSKSVYEPPYEWDLNKRDKRDSGNPVVHFKMSHQTGPLVPVRPQQKDIELRNVGTYNLAVESVHLIYDRTAPLLRDTFTVSIEDVEPSLQPSPSSPGRPSENPEGPILVAPGKSIRLRVVYEPNCYVAHIEQELVLVVDDQTIRVPLLVDVRPSGSFDCLRAKVPVTVRALTLLVWKLVVLWAVVVAVYSVYYGLSDVWSVYCREMALRVSDHQSSTAVVDKEMAMADSAAGDTLEASGLENDKHEATIRLLDKLEANCFVPDTRGVQTPGVTKLLHAREKKKSSSVAIKKQSKEDSLPALEPEAVLKTPAPLALAPLSPTQETPLRLEQSEKPVVVTSTPSPKSKPAAVNGTKAKPLVKRVPPPSPAKPASPAVLVKPASPPSASVETVVNTVASQKTRAKSKAAKSKSLSPPRTVASPEAEPPTPVPSPTTALRSTAAQVELTAEPVATVADNIGGLERKAALKAKKAARQSRLKRPNQDRNAAARPPVDLSSAALGSNGLNINIDIPERVDDGLASSMGSTSTTVSFDSEDLKLSPAKTEPESAVDTDDFFLSMTFEAPFSSFGAIGKRRTASPQQRGLSSSDNQEDDEDAVLVERFGLGGLNTRTARGVTTGALNGIATTEPSAPSREALDTVDDDDWSDLYFDSIRSEIGRLVAGADSVTSNSRSSGFGALHAHPSAGSDALAFNLQHPPERTSVTTSTSPAATTTASSSTASSPPTSVTKKKTPPGFTAADANPLESLAAFERLRSVSRASAAAPSTAAATATAPAALGANTGSRFAFASRFSLFGPTSSPFGLDQSGAARAESNATSASGSNVLRRGVTSASTAAHDDWGSGAPLLRTQGSQLPPATTRSRNALASLGGVELPSPSSASTPALQ